MAREIKVGDRVHVEFDGEVRGFSPAGLVYLANDWAVPYFACTVIVPPVKVGDIVTPDNIGQLPPRSVIASDREVAMSVPTGCWFIDGSEQSRSSEKLIARTDSYRVLRIGGAS
jgi:hypothetical protein